LNAELATRLTCSKYQSGEIDWSGRISRCGDEMMRVMLYEAAQSMLRSKKWSWLKAWAMQIARRRGLPTVYVIAFSPGQWSLNDPAKHSTRLAPFDCLARKNFC
jgi:transposase